MYICVVITESNMRKDTEVFSSMGVAGPRKSTSFPNCELDLMTRSSDNRGATRNNGIQVVPYHFLYSRSRRCRVGCDCATFFSPMQMPQISIRVKRLEQPDGKKWAPALGAARLNLCHYRTIVSSE